MARQSSAVSRRGIMASIQSYGAVRTVLLEPKGRTLY
jgi:hypothetical protein